MWISIYNVSSLKEVLYSIAVSQGLRSFYLQDHLVKH